MTSYNPQKIEAKWQKIWLKSNQNRAEDFSKKPKFYCLVEFPYPSGERLHVGHARSYIALDVIARLKRMQGNNVLFPIGWDAFGLPAENYALKTGIHPRVTTKKNIANAKQQLLSWACSFDWSREINTTDPAYYKWTQWIFLQLYKMGLAYKAKIAINWCPSCKIGLANEEVVAGECERCGTKTESKDLEQWMLKITAYADRLINDLGKVDYLPQIKTQQVNWIGRSEGAEIKFSIFPKGSLRDNSQFSIPVFTTRADTLFGATYLVLSPEHELVDKVTANGQKKLVEEYQAQAQKKSELERTKLEKDKTGVFTGAYAINPINNQKIPIWIADYVVLSYGTGAIMAVPAHDKRDWQFAKKYRLPIKMVICPNYPRPVCPVLENAFTDYGRLVDSKEFTGLTSEEAKKKIIEKLRQTGFGDFALNYKLRDWVFSRQHYWGEPIPIIYCRKCWENQKSKACPQCHSVGRRVKNQNYGVDYIIKNDLEYAIVPVPKKDLPVELPMVEKYQPTGTGESPLAGIKEWVNTKCPKCGGLAQRETDTMPNWAGSSWYFIRYTDPKNNQAVAAQEKMKYWLPVDIYDGGMEHTTLHLLYSRFWYKALNDAGIVPTDEPYKRRHSHGVILGPNNQKMSKSRGNVVNPDKVIEKYSADTFRLYEMFIGPFEEMVAWNDGGIAGVYRFVQKVWRLFEKPISEGKSNIEELRAIHKTIKKVSDDILNFRFNTAVSALMILVNELTQLPKQNQEALELLLLIFSPFAPYLAEELWQKLGHENSIFQEPWPKVQEKYLKAPKMTIVIQVNGKIRATKDFPREADKSQIEKEALSLPQIQKWLEDKKIQKTIYVPSKLINFVVKL